MTTMTTCTFIIGYIVPHFTVIIWLTRTCSKNSMEKMLWCIESINTDRWAEAELDTDKLYIFLSRFTNNNLCFSLRVAASS